MGSRYTEQEKQEIQAFVNEGLTNKQIAEKLSRPEAGIRNLRYRENIEAKTRETIQSLNRDKLSLRNKILDLEVKKSELSKEIDKLEAQQRHVKLALSIDESILKLRLQNTLQTLKHEQPKLFYITGEDQLIEIAEIILASFTRWLNS